MPTPLRPLSGEAEGPDSPEAMMISAMLEAGAFTPDKYHLRESDLGCWEKLWRFCTEYQEKTGNCPPLELVTKKFPDFTLMKGLDVGWCAGELHKASAGRRLRKQMLAASEALGDGDIDQAYALLEGIQRPRTTRRAPASAFDHDEDDVLEPNRLLVPYPTLGRATGGVAPGDLWYLTARPSTGKTFELVYYAELLVELGAHVRFLSLEMPAKKIKKRFRRAMAQRKDPKLLKALDSSDQGEQKRAIDELKEMTTGSFTVIDTGYGRISTSTVREAQDEAEVVMVDHAGLLRAPDGRRAIEDWRVMAVISNILKEDANATGVPIIAAAQLNKQGTVSQSDALLQDADVLVAMKRPSKSVMHHVAEKVREGPSVKWYSRFDPAQARFEEISHETAYSLQAADDTAET